MSTERKLKILKTILGDFYKNSSEHLFYCPKCEHHKRKLSINLDKNVFKCWVCDWSGGDIYRIVRRYGSYSSKEEWKSFSDRTDIENFAQKLFGAPEVQEEQVVDLPKEFVSLVNKNLPATSLYALNYLQSRGITKLDIARWKMGFCSEGPYAGRVIVPSFGLTGQANYFVARTYSHDWKKYQNPAASRDIVFNHLYLDFDEDMVLVEGVFDAVIAGPNAVPLLGSTLREDSALFQEIVKNDTAIYLALDPDAEKKAMDLVKKFLKYDIEIYKIDVAPYGDVGEMSKEEFSRRKQSAAFINSSNYLLRKIQGI
tara:strand:+ start:237 stop:1175 length:939 start_codon:yes stop_codon:yes gene_type:complete